MRVREKNNNKRIKKISVLYNLVNVRFILLNT